MSSNEKPITGEDLHRLFEISTIKGSEGSVSIPVSPRQRWLKAILPEASFINMKKQNQDWVISHSGRAGRSLPLCGFLTLRARFDIATGCIQPNTIEVMTWWGSSKYNQQGRMVPVREGAVASEYEQNLVGFVRKTLGNHGLT